MRGPVLKVFVTMIILSVPRKSVSSVLSLNGACFGRGLHLPHYFGFVFCTDGMISRAGSQSSVTFHQGQNTNLCIQDPLDQVRSCVASARMLRLALSVHSLHCIGVQRLEFSETLAASGDRLCSHI